MHSVKSRKRLTKFEKLYDVTVKVRSRDRCEWERARANL